VKSLKRYQDEKDESSALSTQAADISLKTVVRVHGSRKSYNVSA